MNIVLVACIHGARSHAVCGLLMRDGTMQSGKIYILKWIKVIAVLKPASEAQINLSGMCVCVRDREREGRGGHPG